MKSRYALNTAHLATVVTMLLCFPISAIAEDPQRLAAERGCTFCHSPEPIKAAGGAVPPPAPAWSDISRRYRGQTGTEDRLVAIVVAGSDPARRHWARTSAVVMPSNQVLVSESEARTLVRWILR